jgi:hypothetical protein
MSEPLYDDPVVAEVHAIRARMLAECGGDHHKLMQLVRERQRKSGRKVIAAPPSKLQRAKESTGATGSAVAGGGS